MTAVGTWIDERLQARDWRVADLKRRMDRIAQAAGSADGPSNQTVQAIVKGKTKRPEELTLRLIALALEEDPAELLALAGHPVEARPRAISEPEEHTPYTEFIDSIYHDLPDNTRDIADDYLSGTVRFLEQLRQRSLEGEQDSPKPRPAIHTDTA